MRDLTDKVFIVTGSTAGIGREVARQILCAGGKVVINGRHEEKREAVHRMFAAFEKKFIYAALDIARDEECRELVEAAVLAFGRIDYVILNAGLTCTGTIETLAPEASARVVAANLTSAFFVLHYALPHLADTRGGLLIVSSLAGLFGLPGHAPYSASKMALIGLYQSLRAECHGNGVFVGIALPGFTKNDPEKVQYAADGNLTQMPSRNDRKVASQETVAARLLGQLRKRSPSFSVHSRLGALAWYVSRFFPGLYARMIRNEWKKNPF
jgi:NAD(P)-dependent dehydrogenase (short-subunit alcohol dehydrogenase family)